MKEVSKPRWLVPSTAKVLDLASTRVLLMLPYLSSSLIRSSMMNTAVGTDRCTTIVCTYALVPVDICMRLGSRRRDSHAVKFPNLVLKRITIIATFPTVKAGLKQLLATLGITAEKLVPVGYLYYASWVQIVMSRLTPHISSRTKRSSMRGADCLVEKSGTTIHACCGKKWRWRKGLRSNILADGRRTVLIC